MRTKQNIEQKAAKIPATHYHWASVQQFLLWTGLFIGLLVFSCGLVKAEDALAAVPETTTLDPQTSLFEMRTKCKTVANLTDEQFRTITKKQLFTNETQPSDVPKKIHCYLLCYFNEAGIFEDNEPNKEKLHTSLLRLVYNETKADTAIDKCSIEFGADHCETAFKFVICMHKETGLYIY